MRSGELAALRLGQGEEVEGGKLRLAAIEGRRKGEAAMAGAHR